MNIVSLITMYPDRIFRQRGQPFHAPPWQMNNNPELNVYLSHAIKKICHTMLIVITALFDNNTVPLPSAVKIFTDTNTF